MAGFSGVSFVLRDTMPTTTNRQAGFSGVSFMITPRTLIIKVRRLDLVTRQWVVVPDVRFVVSLSMGALLVNVVTAATGNGQLDFPDGYIEVMVDATTIPNGYSYDTHHKITTRARNFITVTLIPDALERYYTEWEVRR